jgi:hypothetical protein
MAIAQTGMRNFVFPYLFRRVYTSVASMRQNAEYAYTCAKKEDDYTPCGHTPLHFYSLLDQTEGCIRPDMELIKSCRCRCHLSRIICLTILLFFVIVLLSFSVTTLLLASYTVQQRLQLNSARLANTVQAPTTPGAPPTPPRKSKYTFENLTLWNRSLCSARSDRRGPHQKIISISVYGSTSNHTDNPMYSWVQSIFPFLEPLVREVELLEPSWVIRLYTDFIGSTRSQRERLSTFPNVDVCNMKYVPLFGSTLLSFLPGKFWRFVPVFDPFVDYFLSRDLDSPITRRETETLDLWTSDQHQDKFFHIARDHDQHGVPILGGLWGAANVRARRQLFDIFEPMLVPSIARTYTGAGDQTFLDQRVWNRVKKHALIFDSYFCQQFGGQPFLSQLIHGSCHLGCIRPCCDIEIDTNATTDRKPCPVACRPKDHQDWTYC